MDMGGGYGFIGPAHPGQPWTLDDFLILGAGGLLAVAIGVAIISYLYNETAWGRQRRGLPAIADLIRDLQDGSRPGRAAIAWALGAEHDDQVVEPLAQATHDPDP